MFRTFVREFFMLILEVSLFVFLLLVALTVAVFFLRLPIDWMYPFAAVFTIVYFILYFSGGFKLIYKKIKQFFSFIGSIFSFIINIFKKIDKFFTTTVIRFLVLIAIGIMKSFSFLSGLIKAPFVRG